MGNTIYQEVFGIIEQFLPDEWVDVVLFAGYTNNSYTIKFYYSVNGTDYIDCFSIPKVQKGKLIRIFMDIDKILSVEREKNSKWYIFTMKVNSDGKMKVDYDYNDHSEDMIRYEKEWKDKYLSL